MFMEKSSIYRPAGTSPIPQYDMKTLKVGLSYFTKCSWGGHGQMGITHWKINHTRKNTKTKKLGRKIKNSHILAHVENFAPPITQLDSSLPNLPLHSTPGQYFTSSTSHRPKKTHPPLSRLGSSQHWAWLQVETQAVGPTPGSRSCD